MALTWIRDSPASWDVDKQRIVGDAREGIFDRRYSQIELGAPISGEWWRVEDHGVVVGFGWLDVVWGDAEILLAADPTARRRGIGGFILDQLAEEARARGLNYLYNRVRPTHPEADELTAFLTKRGFVSSDGGSLMRTLIPRR